MIIKWCKTILLTLWTLYYIQYTILIHVNNIILSVLWSLFDIFIFSCKMCNEPTFIFYFFFFFFWKAKKKKKTVRKHCVWLMLSTIGHITEIFSLTFHNNPMILLINYSENACISYICQDSCWLFTQTHKWEVLVLKHIQNAEGDF